MGIPISSRFINIVECKEILKDIIFTNFFYYSILDNYDLDEVEYIKNRCKILLESRVQINVNQIFNQLWNSVYIELIDDKIDMMFL